MEPQKHWDGIHRSKKDTEVSWYESVPRVSLDYIEALELEGDATIADVGGGTSLLVDHPVDRGHTNLAAVDIPWEALAKSRQSPGGVRVRSHGAALWNLRLNWQGNKVRPRESTSKRQQHR